MVQNFTTKNSSLMDLSKVESQALSEQRRSVQPSNMNTFLQDILCFFILLSLGLIIVASIFCVVLNVHISATQLHSQLNKSTNISRIMPADGPAKLEHLRLQHGPIWMRFFRCQKHQQPQPDANLEQVREPEQDLGQGQRQPVKLEKQNKQQPYFFPTYPPIDYSELAGGDYAEAGATVKQSDSGPQPFPVDNFLRK